MRRASPLPGAGLTGYAAERTVGPGETVELMFAGSPGEATARLVRLVHGDPNPAGPGVREEDVAWWERRAVAVEERSTPFGSYVEVRDETFFTGLERGVTVALWFLPTLLRGGWHALATKWGRGRASLGLFLAGDGILTCGLSHDGTTAAWVTAHGFASAPRWQFAAVSFDPESGMAAIHHGPGAGDLNAVHKRVPAGALAESDAPFLLGACADPAGSEPAWAHFNGRIAHPVVFAEPLGADALDALAAGEDPAGLGQLHACWDLAREVSSERVVDVSGARRDGRAVNAPARAVTGPRFDGVPATLFEDGADAYGAIHLHDDDLDDAGWPPSVSVRVPEAARSGLYALRVERAGDALALPFVVRPAGPGCDLAVLVPTLTWQAYGTNNQPWSYTDDGVIDAGVCLYNTHSDGSPVYYSSRRRPTRSGDPSAGFANWGAHNLTANLYLVDWLERLGFAYDTFADEDLHGAGARLLEPYRCLILGSHPEYWTAAMVDALEAYIAGGGRVVYLGGNGLFWVTSIDRARSHLLEVRKERGQWPADFPNPIVEVGDGERRHSSTLEIGGTWRSRGRPPSALLGVEYSADLFEQSRGRWRFERLRDAADKRLAWVFEGVGDDLGASGLNLGSAAGFEMDGAVDPPGGDPAFENFLLARASHDAFEPAAYGAQPPVADVVLRTHPGGAAVFSAGSVSWTGSLSQSDYAGDVSRLTENVLRRFLETPSGTRVVDPPVASEIA